MRTIPSTMATQHPDNACGPFWEKDGDGFVSVREEPQEAMQCLTELGTEEFMWDWEGKYADEAVIDKLFSRYYEYFHKNILGRDEFLTFRLPNVWKEKGYSLLRALMVILTSEDFAQDLGFKSRPLFEVILPMTETAEQLLYIQKSYQKLARFKSKTFDHSKNVNTDYLEIIPLVEGVENQLGIGKLLRNFTELHKKHFKTKPPYLRPFLARSDPALVSGLLATMLGNKIALSDIYDFSRESKVDVYPIIGVGSLVFRGGCNPERPQDFLKEYGGVRTVTIQSAFRYDYPLVQAKKAVKYFNENLPSSEVQQVSASHRRTLLGIIPKAGKVYQFTIARIVKDMQPIFDAVPRRRERRQHIGFLSYSRSMGKHSLPRAINFTAAMYSVGVPPELIGLGRVLQSLSAKEMEVVRMYYKNLVQDVQGCARFVNRANVRALARQNSAWQLVENDLALLEGILKIKIEPKTQPELLHENLSSQLLLQRNRQTEVTRLIVETGKLRKSLG